MTSITIEEDGSEKLITDIAPYRDEREAVLAKLAPIYADFDEGAVDALAAREQEIVDLANRYNELTDLIERFEEATTRRANVLAGWEIVKQHRADGA